MALVASMFGPAIDCARVRIHRRRWWPLQPRGVVMAPCGDLHFHPASPHFHDDFALASLELQGLFIHEMVHVWQAQTRGRLYLPLHRHPFCRYRYRLIPGRPFERYGIEQQAEIVRHAFLARQLQQSRPAPGDGEATERDDKKHVLSPSKGGEPVFVDRSRGNKNPEPDVVSTKRHQALERLLPFICS